MRRATTTTARDDARQRLAAAAARLRSDDGDAHGALLWACRAASLRVAEGLGRAPRARLDAGAAARVARVDDLLAGAPWTVDALADAYQSLLEAPDDDAAAHARRRGGSYYTPPALVDAVLREALDPLLAAALAQDDPERALLALTVCDPACGAGRFLVAAARRIAAALAREGALADVVARCVRGVDRDAAAVELCRVALWCEAPADCLPWEHLAASVRQGNALLGAARASEEPAWLAGAGDVALFHWHRAFAELAPGAGFDAVVGNPPWIAHAGRAAQPLPPAERALLAARNPAFRGYVSTHGAFVHRAASLLAPGGRLGLVLPTSVADLDGYRPARAAHDALCEVAAPLASFGNGHFEGVFQPCMALVSTRRPAPLGPQPGAPWPLDGAGLAGEALDLLARLGALETLPAAMFGERGLQTDAALLSKIVAAAEATDAHTVGLREGKDIRAFRLGPAGLRARPEDLARRMRDPAEYRAVDVVVRQTARYPIAARSDGQPFRNTLLAAFAAPPWTPDALAGLLNASLVRWFHYHRFRDAREGMPQVKIGHLRALPAPPAGGDLAPLAALSASLSARNEGLDDDARAALDGLVYDLYALGPRDRALVEAWARDPPR